MEAEWQLGYDNNSSYIVTIQGEVTSISSNFTDLTSYTLDDLKQKDIESVFIILNIQKHEDIYNHLVNKPMYIFTKFMQPRYVHIYCVTGHKQDEIIYYFEEIPKSRLDEKIGFYEQLFRDNVFSLAVCSVPDFTLIKVNQRYLSFLPEPFNEPRNCLGKLPETLLKGCCTEEHVALFKKAVSEAKTTYAKEVKFSDYEGKVTYWDFSFIPITEDDKVKYVVLQGIDVTESVVSREALKESNHDLYMKSIKLQTLFDIIPIGIYMVDKNGNYLEINKKLKSTLRNNISYSVGQSLSKCSYYDADGNELSLSQLPSSRVIRGEEMIEETIIMKSGDNETYHSVSCTPTFDEEGNFYRGIIVSVDITESVRKTKSLQQSEAELQAIIDSMTDGVFTLDTNGNFKIINSGAQNLLNAPKKILKVPELFSTAKFYNLEGRQVSLDEMPGQIVLKGKKLKTYRLSKVTPEKTTHFSYSGSPIYDEKGNVSKAVICAREVTDIVNWEKMVRSQRDDLYKIINEIDFPIARLSYPELKTIQINNSIVEFLKNTPGNSGLDIEVISKMSMYDLARIINIEKSMECIRRAVESKKSIYLKEQKVNIDGIEKCFKTVYQPILGADNEVIEIIIILIDVTKEVKHREQIEKTLEMQGEFFSFIAHEFRTPLTTISATLQLLDLVYAKEMSPNLKRYINTIRRSTFQQLRLVNNLLDITRAEAGYLKVYRKNHDIVSVTRAIVYSIKPFAEDKNIRLRFRSSLKEKIVSLDDEKYERILLNLLSNAIKFTPSNQSIWVTLSENDGKIFVCVKDKGIGIPKDKQTHIFERFGQEGSRRSRSGEGTGIGLYLVKLLVESMNGGISLCSNVDRGSSFIVTLPADTLEVEELDTLPELTNNRLIQGMQLEFSNIYI
jgi:signal transduction histidine kinase/PAS domain-containing protein